MHRWLLDFKILLIFSVFFLKEAPVNAGSISQAVLLVKSMSYSRAISNRLKKEPNQAILLGFIYPKEGLTGRCLVMLDELKQNSKIQIIPIKYENSQSLKNQTNLMAIYVCSGLKQEISSIAKFTRSAHILSFAERVEDVISGLSIGFEGTTERIGIVINQSASIEEAAELDARFILIARKI